MCGSGQKQNSEDSFTNILWILNTTPASDHRASVWSFRSSRFISRGLLQCPEDLYRLMQWPDGLTRERTDSKLLPSGWRSTRCDGEVARTLWHLSQSVCPLRWRGRVEPRGRAFKQLLLTDTRLCRETSPHFILSHASRDRKDWCRLCRFVRTSRCELLICPCQILS